jgi:hypothetical protein
MRIHTQTHEWNKVFLFTLFFLAHSVCSYSRRRYRHSARVYRIPPPISSPLVFKWLFFNRGLLKRRRAKKKWSKTNPLPRHRTATGPARPEWFLYFIFRLFLRTAAYILQYMYTYAYIQHTHGAADKHTRFGYQFIQDIMMRTCAYLARAGACAWRF